MHLQGAQVRGSRSLLDGGGLGNNGWVASHLSSRMSESRKHWGRRGLGGGNGGSRGDERLSNKGWVASHLSCGVSETRKGRNWARCERSRSRSWRSGSRTSDMSKSRESWDATGTNGWSRSSLAWIVSAECVSLKSSVRLQWMEFNVRETISMSWQSTLKYVTYSGEQGTWSKCRGGGDRDSDNSGSELHCVCREKL